MHNSERRRSSRRLPEGRDTHTYNRKEHIPRLPGCLFTVLITLVISALEGFIAVIAPIGITYANASFYMQAANQDANVSLEAEYIFILLGFFGIICSGIIIFFLTTLMTLCYPKYKQGCLTGALSGAWTFAWLFVAPYFIHLPGSLSSSPKTSADGSWLVGLSALGIGMVFYTVAGVIGNKSGDVFGSWLRRGLMEK